MHNKKLIIKQRNEYIKKTKDDFTKLVEFPCPDWLTTDVYNNWMRTRDRVEFNLTTTFQSFLPGNEINKMTYNPAWNSNQLSCSPKFLYDKYLKDEIISTPDSGQDPKVYSKENLDNAAKHAARQWGYYKKVEKSLNDQGELMVNAPSTWMQHGAFNVINIEVDGEVKSVLVPIDVEHRVWGLIGFPLGCVPLPIDFQDLYFYHQGLPRVYDELTDQHTHRIKINGMFLDQIVFACNQAAGGEIVNADDIRNRFWENNFNFTFLPNYSRDGTEEYFGEINDTSAKSPKQLFHAYTNDSHYWVKDLSSIKVTKFKAAEKHLHPLFQMMPQSSQASLESMMITYLVGEYNVGGKELIDRADTKLIASFKKHGEYTDEIREKIIEDLDFVYDLAKRVINPMKKNEFIEISRPLVMNWIHMRNTLKGLNYYIVDKDLFANAWYEWFTEESEEKNGDLGRFILAWRKATKFKETFDIIREEFLDELRPERLRELGIMKRVSYKEQRTLPTPKVQKLYKEQNGKDINGKDFIYPHAAHWISDMELIRMSEDEKDEAFREEGLGEKFVFDKNFFAMSQKHNERMSVLRISEYKEIMHLSDEEVKLHVLKKYKKLKEKEILIDG